MHNSQQSILQASQQEIRAALGALFAAGDIVELRAFIPSNYSSKPNILAGYFDDFDVLSKTAANLSNNGAYGLYITPQEINSDLLARALNKTKKGIKTTSDKDVTRYRYLLIDLDANRVSGVSSTLEEKKAAFDKLREVYSYLKSQGWPEPIFGDSGNGAHLLYRVDLAPDSDLIERCLRALSFMFDTDKVIVDQTVFNPSRIWKLYGTATRKGDSTPERPHRKARLLKAPEKAEKVSQRLLHKLAKRVPAEPQRAKLGSAGTERAKLTTWVHQHLSDTVVGPISWPGKGVRWLFDECPWDPTHTDRSAFIVHFDRGGIAAGCHHEDCPGNKSNTKKNDTGWDRLQAKYTKLKPPKPPSPPDSMGPIVPPSPNSPGYTDTGNALRLVRAHQANIRYVPKWQRWLVYSGRRWAVDDSQQIMQYAKNSIDAMYVEAAGLAQTDPATANKLFKWAVKSGSASSRRNMISLAESEPGIPIQTAELDRDPWKLNVLNGTLNLKTGELAPHSRTDLITKVAKVEYDPAAKCPTWDAFMLTVMGDKQHLVDYLHAYIGYSLTGVITEQTLAFLHGTGSNGKSTFLSTIQKLMGDYARQAAPELLLSKTTSDHPTSIADLQGARFVATSEIDRGRHFAEALIKQLTGGETIKARFMRQDFFEFDPTHKLWIAANHKPIIKGNDWAIWRRIRLIPFEVTIPDDKQDKNLPHKLTAELPGILNRFVEGCLLWQSGGLKPPPEVMVATEEYKDEMDLLKDFLDEWCVQREGVRVEVSVLYERYLDWCEITGDRKPINKKYLGRLLKERGFKQCKKGGHRAWEGIALKPHNPVSAKSSQARWN